jgi:type VI secretion system protein ImpE
MTAHELFRAGKLNEAAQRASLDLRDRPTDVRLRTFLFELLCFNGEFDRAGKHLSVLAQSGTDAETGTLLYRSAIAAERKRQVFFEGGEFKSLSSEQSAKCPGTINGRAFDTIEDVDARIGPRLEVFVAGEYVWLPFAQIGSVRMEAPKLLRDTLWATAQVMAGPGNKGQEFGEVLLPVQYPFSWRNTSDDVKLGRVTEWLSTDGSTGEVPVGQKLLLIDGSEEISFLEIRELIFHSPSSEEPKEA